MTVILPLIQRELDQLSLGDKDNSEINNIGRAIVKFLKLFLIFQGLAREASRFDKVTRTPRTVAVKCLFY